jgi:hypothetical protein
MKAEPDKVRSIKAELTKIETWPTDRPIPYEGNAKNHPPAQVKLIMNSMREFGFTYPLLVDEEGIIIAGHGRLMAAKALKLETVNVLVAEGWSEDQKRAYRIADNKLTELGEWNLDALAAEFTALDQAGFDLDVMGFSAEEMQEFPGFGLPDGSNVSGEELRPADEVFGEPETVPEKGSVWKLGDHYLVVASPIDGWPAFLEYLVPGALLAVYPGLYVPFAKRAVGRALVMVQPDEWTAGHMIDRWRISGGTVEGPL